MNRALVIACLSLGLLSPAALAEDANRYEVVVVPSAGLSGDKTETLLIDRQTGKTWVLTTEYDATLTSKGTYWVPQRFRIEPADDSKPFLPLN